MSAWQFVFALLALFTMKKEITLVLGGVRSGKSAFAENLALKYSECPTYLATSEIYDAEMQERISVHKNRRKENWQLIEEPINMADAIMGNGHKAIGNIVLVDCLTIWLANLLQYGLDINAEINKLLICLEKADKNIILVANEVGLGGIAENALARKFADIQGKLNQEIAKIADNVVFVAAGLPMVMKGKI